LCKDPLLVRDGRKLALTPRAVQMLPSLERGLSDLRSVITGEPAFEPASARRRFSFAMPDYHQSVLLMPLLQKLERAAPLVDLSVVPFPNMTEVLEAGSADVAVVVSGSIAPSFSTQKLFSDKFVCMVRKDHPRVPKKLTLEAYLSLRHVLVAPGGAPGSIVDSELERRGLRRRVALTVSSFLLAPVVVAETDFISTSPERLARRLAERFRLRLVEPPLRLPSFSFSLAWHPRLDHDPAHRWLRGLIAGVCAEM
jgi:DNA-binding transcriptional LysR family regulator